MPDPWSNQLQQLLIIAASITGFSGIFVYSPAPGPGNLVASIAASNGTDPYGNAYVEGIAEYAEISGSPIYMTMGEPIPGSPGFFIQNQSSPADIPPFISGGPLTATSAELQLCSGRGNPASQECFVSLLDSVAAGSANGEIQLSAGTVLFGNSNAALWADNQQQLNLPAGGGPFIAGQSFQFVSSSGGLTGSYRIKILPWNAVWFEGQGSFTYSGSAQTFTLGNLPSAAFYPIASLNRPVAITGTPSGIATSPPRLFIPTSGGPQLVVPSGSGSGNVGWSLMYPTN